MIAYADYHTHTKYSHGKGTVLENVEVAAAKKLQEIAISDHGPSHMLGIGIANLAVLDQIQTEINQAMEVYPQVKVKLGVEANVTSIEGDIDLPPEYISKIDVVQVGLHLMVRPQRLLDGLQRTGYHFLRRLGSSFSKKSLLLNTEAIVNAVYRHEIDIITHPGHRFLIDTRELAKACAQRNTAFEINTSHHNMNVELIEIAAKEGVDFVIGSDAHHPSRVGDLQPGIELAQAAGLAADQIRNVF